MGTRNSVVISALLAVIIAAGVIVAYSSLGGFVATTTTSSLTSSSSSAESSVSQVNSGVATSVLETTVSNPSSASTQSGTAQGTSGSQTSSSNSLTSSTTTSQSSAGGQSSNGQTGTLAVLMTDPPTVPNGVTAVYISYANLAIHVSNAGNQTGWHVLQQSGQINLMSVINFTQTISNANITSGNFNALGFNITSATITYQGQNYTAYLVYGHSLLFVPIVGGISIQKGVTSVAVIDISPTVLLLTNSSSSTSFSFAFIPSATAYIVPAQSVPNLHLTVGGRDNIQTATWWIIILRHSHFDITAATLTPSSLSVTVTNTGNASIVFHEVELSATVSKSGGPIPAKVISEMFVCEPNASLVPLAGVRGIPMVLQIVAGGYLLAPGASVTFKYSGNFSIGENPVPIIVSPPMTAVTTQGTTTTVTTTQTSTTQTQQGVVVGQRYIISVYGNAQVAQTEVTATSS